MKPTRRTKLDRLLREMLEDEALDLAAVAESLRAWAVRFDFRAASRWADWKSPDRGGRPRERGFLDDADPTFLTALFEHFAGLVRTFRPLARRVRNPATFRARVPSGRDLLCLYEGSERYRFTLPSGDADFQEMFRKRFTALAADLKTPPQLAAASLVLWYGQADDSPEEAARLVERLKKQGKTRPK